MNLFTFPDLDKERVLCSANMIFNRTHMCVYMNFGVAYAQIGFELLANGASLDK